jgi:hypothetical protein
MHWYGMLTRATEKDTEDRIGLVRQSHFRTRDEARGRQECEDDGDGDRGGIDNNSDKELRRPTEYLRKRCPLCFGGRNIHDAESLLVSYFLFYYQNNDFVAELMLLPVSMPVSHKKD